MNYKNIFIVDPVRGERIHLAKFLKHDKFTVMAFVTASDCYKRNKWLTPDLIVYVLRPGKTELKHLLNIKGKGKNIPIIVLSPQGSEDVNLVQLDDAGFTQVFKANSNEKIREIAYGLLAPEGLTPREETPHPVPLT